MKKYLFILLFTASSLFADDDCSKSPPLKGRSVEVIRAICEKLETDDQIAVEDLASIKKLSFWKVGLRALRPGDFAGLTSLEGLDLGRNRLTTLPEGVFAGLSALEWLTLDENQLATLPKGIFAELVALEQLNLHRNELTTLQEGVFAGLTGLKRLYLYENEIRTLEKGVFSELAALRLLDLRSNQLTSASLREGAFVGLAWENMDVINLKQNRLKELSEKAFGDDPPTIQHFVWGARIVEDTWIDADSDKSWLAFWMERFLG